MDNGHEKIQRKFVLEVGALEQELRRYSEGGRGGQHLLGFPPHH